MNRTLWISVLLGLISVSTAQAGPTTRPIIVYSQNDKNFQPLNLIYGNESASAYFDLTDGNANPAFGTASGTASLAFYYDLSNGAMSLLSIVGTPDGQTGSVVETITGVPRGASVTLAQDPSEITTHHKGTLVHSALSFGATTDGTVLGTLQNAKFALKVSLSSEDNVSELRLANGDPSAGGEFLDLNLDEPVYFDRVWLGRHGHPDVGALPGGSSGDSSGDGSGNVTEVPEPATLGLVAAASAIFMLRPRRR